MQIRLDSWMLGLAMSIAALHFGAGAAAQPINRVVIEVNDTATEADDYFCWAPVSTAA